MKLASARTMVGLVVLILIAASHADNILIAACVLPFLLTLLAAELDRSSARVSRPVVRAAARFVPARDRDDLHDEWLDHVASAGEHGVLPLTRALTIALIAAPLLAVGLRVGRRRRRAT
jgi:hypothetical protein